MADTTSIDACRNRVFVGYAVAGFVVAAIYLYSQVDTVVSEVSDNQAMAFIGILAGFLWLGGSVANAIRKDDQGCFPWSNGRATLRCLASEFPALVFFLAVALALLWGSAPGFLYPAALGYAYWMRWRVRTRDDRE